MKETLPSQKHQSVRQWGSIVDQMNPVNTIMHEVMSNFRCSGRSEEPTQVRDSV
jgi:hypothetical protein